MNDHTLVRAAMNAADPAPENPSEVAITLVTRQEPEAGGIEALDVDRHAGWRERRGARRWIAAVAAATVAVIAVSSLVILVVGGGSPERSSVARPASVSSDPWCQQRPLVEQPTSESPDSLRAYYTAQLAYALISAELAPPAISYEATVVAQDIRRIHGQLEATGWVDDGIDPSAEADAAAQAVRDFRTIACP